MLSATFALLLSLPFLSLRLTGNGGSFPRPLSAAEEQECLERFAKGDMEARNILIERNLRLVAHIIKKYYTQTSDQDDLISIGTIGLIKGVSSYRPDKGVRLATYASRCIENAMLTQRHTMYSRVRRYGDIAGVRLFYIIFLEYPMFPVKILHLQKAIIIDNIGK